MDNETKDNPNNCATCNYKIVHNKDEGWCYMFRNEPTDVCAQHTGRQTVFMLPI